MKKRLLSYQQFMNEGLINSAKAADLVKSVKKLFRKWGAGVDIGGADIIEDVPDRLGDDNVYSIFMRVYTADISAEERQKQIMQTVNALGWTMSGGEVDGGGNGDHLKSPAELAAAIRDAMEDGATAGETFLIFDSKFEEPRPNTSIRYLYHITEERYMEKVLKNGLVPKHKDKLAHHPDRVYLTTRANLEVLAGRYCDFVKNPVVLKVNVHGMKLYRDPKAQESWFTGENIGPDKITRTNIDIKCNKEGDLVAFQIKKAA